MSRERVKNFSQTKELKLNETYKTYDVEIVIYKH